MMFRLRKPLVESEWHAHFVWLPMIVEQDDDEYMIFLHSVFRKAVSNKTATNPNPYIYTLKTPDGYVPR